MGAKIKTQYMTLCAILYLQNCAAGIRGHYHKSSDCFEYPKKSLPESKLLNPQKSFDHPRLLKSGVPSMVIYIILQVQEIKLKVAKLRALAICQNRMARPILLYREFHCLGKC